MKLGNWTVLDERAGVLTYDYPFSGGALATAITFKGPEGLVVVSPPSGLDARDYDALRELGEVRALVANNAYHHMGQAGFRARFRDAESYAPEAALSRLGKKAQGVAFRSLSSLTLPPHVRCEAMPGFSTGETLLRITTARGALWYAGDLLANMTSLPKPPVRWLFQLTDSAPGLKLFRMAVWMMVKDKAAVREFVRARLDEEPPALVVPAHGVPFDTGDVAAAMRAQIARL